MTSRWVSKEPWEKFRRATFMPARIICSMISGVSEAGPMVQTILVLLGGNVMEYLRNHLSGIEPIVRSQTPIHDSPRHK